MRIIRTITISFLSICLLAGAAVGVVAQDEPRSGLAEVTGRAIFGPWLHDPGVVTTPEGIVVGEGFAFIHGWETSDPRLNGEVTRTVTFHNQPDAGGIESVAYELTNDGGSWVGEGHSYGIGALGSGTDGAGFVSLTGRGGYTGLTALIVHEGGLDDGGWDLKGIIFPTDLPEIPEPYVAD